VIDAHSAFPAAREDASAQVFAGIVGILGISRGCLRSRDNSLAEPSGTCAQTSQCSSFQKPSSTQFDWIP